MKYYRKKIKIKGKRYVEARVMMEKHLNRKLSVYEAVHHKDGNPLNNSIENLEVMSIEEHISLHHGGKKHNYPNQRRLKDGTIQLLKRGGN